MADKLAKEILLNGELISFGGSGKGIKQGTRAEIDAMILSGEIEEGDSYIVNDEEAMYNPADLNDIRDKQKWKLVGSATSNNKITLPTDYEEVLVDISRGSNNASFTSVFAKEQLRSTSFLYTYTYSTTTATLRISKTEAFLNSYMDGSTSSISACTTTIYYR